MEVWAEQLVNGLTLGSIYALIALGYSMVYGILQMINFAHGEVFMIGAFAGHLVLSRFQDAGPLVIVAAIAAGMAASVVVAVAVERVAYRPLRRAPRLAPLISAIGVSIFLQNVVLRATNAQPQAIPPVFPSGAVHLGGLDISYIRFFLIAMSFVFLAILYAFVRRTRLGKAIRAVAEDKDAAALMGIDVDRAIVLTFALGAALAGAAGVLWGMFFGQIDYFMGFIPGIKAFTAAVLGGIGNIPGAMLGGYFLGLAETFGVQILPAAYKDVVAFTLLVLVLIFRPTGILGEVVGKRA